MEVVCYNQFYNVIINVAYACGMLLIFYGKLFVNVELKVGHDLVI